MLSPNHFIAGIIASEKISSKWKNNQKSLSVRNSIIIGSLISVLIDIDGLFIHPNHHKFLFHYPIFWISIFLIFFTLSKISRIKKFKDVGIIVLAVAMIHLILDTLSAVTIGVFWLWPISNHEFSLFPIKGAMGIGQEWRNYYFSHPMMIAESLFFVAGSLYILLIIRKRSHKD